jgi:hypothetical protein
MLGFPFPWGLAQQASVDDREPRFFLVPFQEALLKPEAGTAVC